MAVEWKDLAEMYKQLVETKAFWARETTIVAVLGILAEEKIRVTPEELSRFERQVRERVPLNSDTDWNKNIGCRYPYEALNA